MGEPKKRNRAFLLGGAGCVGVVALFCCTGGGAYVWELKSIGYAAEERAELFLGRVQASDYGAAFDTSEYDAATSIYSSGQFQTCLASTPLGDMTSFTCHSAEADFFDGDADVRCTIQSAGQGSQDITMHVKSAETSPYLGFIWFSPGVVFGDAWPGDECARWSGREGLGDTPRGRIRPGPSGYGH